MKVIGLTGGIGSGKTTVAKMFNDLNIPVYIADEASKALMNTSAEVKNGVLTLFGEKAYSGNILDRKYIASQVFTSEEKLKKLNQIIHPAVAQDFSQWISNQETFYVIYEAAILFETGGNDKCDQVILVTAPLEIKISRLQKRDQSTIPEIEARMTHQWPDERKLKMADFVIKNTEIISTRLQVRKIHDFLLKASKR